MRCWRVDDYQRSAQLFSYRGVTYPMINRFLSRRRDDPATSCSLRVREDGHGCSRNRTVCDDRWAVGYEEGAIAFRGMLSLRAIALGSYMSFVVWRVVHTLVLATFVPGLMGGLRAPIQSFRSSRCCT